MMNDVTKFGLRAAALVLSSFALCTVAVAGPVGLVDDFSTPGLGEYTLTRVNDPGIAEANISFTDASGALVANYGGTVANAEQVLFLRNSSNLAVGETLTVDVAQAVSTFEMDFGIALSATATPTGVGNPTPTDVRTGFDWLSVSVRPNQNAIRVNTVNAGTLVTASHVINNVDEITVSKLFIERITATTFNVGYTDTSAINHIANATPLTFTAANVGTAIGFYADLRAIGGTLGGLDNLRIVASPLPGDVTGEGAIDINDFNIIKMNLFKTGQTRAQGDLTNDTLVDFADFRQWKTAAGSGFASVTLGVPEPTTMLLLALGGGLFSLIRSPRRSRG
jgi:hypothetical protein